MLYTSLYYPFYNYLFADVIYLGIIFYYWFFVRPYIRGLILLGGKNPGHQINLSGPSLENLYCRYIFTSQLLGETPKYYVRFDILIL